MTDRIACGCAVEELDVEDVWITETHCFCSVVLRASVSFSFVLVAAYMCFCGTHHSLLMHSMVFFDFD
jgi:hypothetical protein